VILSVLVLLVPLCFAALKHFQHRPDKNAVSPAPYNPYNNHKQPPTPMLRTGSKLQVSEVVKAEGEFELVPHTEHNA
jgi:hypothetical protein